MPTLPHLSADDIVPFIPEINRLADLGWTLCLNHLDAEWHVCMTHQAVKHVAILRGNTYRCDPDPRNIHQRCRVLGVALKGVLEQVNQIAEIT